jgi:CBS domain containing-hemolysin-like protein
MSVKEILDRLLGRDGEAGDYRELNVEKRDMIRGIVELSETTVKEVMVPRIDTVFISVDMSRDDCLNRIAESGHSRFPVYKDTIDNVIGVLYAKDLLRAMVTGQELQLSSLVRKPFFVPESKHIDDLLREFKRRRVHIAVAVDEYGGVSGIVCMEDIIEEIVGDIQDEFDNEREDILQIGDGVYLCDARVNLDDLGRSCPWNCRARISTPSAASCSTCSGRSRLSTRRRASTGTTSSSRIWTDTRSIP